VGWLFVRLVADDLIQNPCLSVQSVAEAESLGLG
jgi:hypothetical protein